MAMRGGCQERICCTFTFARLEHPANELAKGGESSSRSQGSAAVTLGMLSQRTLSLSCIKGCFTKLSGSLPPVGISAGRPTTSA